MKLDGGGGTHKATTTHKQKPDGTREVSHSVEQTLPDMMRRAKVNKAQTPSHPRPLATDRVHHAIIGRDQQPVNTIADTLRMLREARQQIDPVPLDSGAFAGDGRFERPAPLDSLMPPDNSTAAAGNTSPQQVLTPAQLWMRDNFPHNELVPRYKGGLRGQLNVGNA